MGALCAAGCRLLGALPCDVDGHCAFGQACRAGSCVPAGATPSEGEGEGEGEGERPPNCGDLGIDADEQCDDGNWLSGDLCSAICRLEHAVTPELESNGAAVIGGAPYGNSLDLALAQGPYSSDALIQGTISPAGDEDYFGVTNTSSAATILRIETFAEGVRTCANGLDTRLVVFDDGAGVIAEDDDAGRGACSRVRFLTLGPGDTDYVLVLHQNDDTDAGGYYLAIDFVEPGCGNAIREGGEQCDDGDADAYDLCTSACTLEVSPTGEQEPNDDGVTDLDGGVNGNDFTTALTQAAPFTVDTLIEGTLDVPGDEDVFAVQNTTGSVLTLSTETYGAALDGTCGTPIGAAIDPAITIRDELGAILASVDDSSGTTCSRAYLSASFQPGQIAYVQVTHANDNATLSYLLRIDL